MRLLLISFEDVLGLNGTIDFRKGQPVIFYGENLAGKTNIVNALRYCLIPKDSRKRKRTYSEEQRLTKDEILLSPLKKGNATIYFTQGENLYKLTYMFKRTSSGNIKQTQRMYDIKSVPIPECTTEKLKEFLETQPWKQLDIYGVNEISKKMIELKIFPEILDTLISPSNVSNFSKTINNEIVTIPKVISQTISTIRDNIRKYLKNLQTMNNSLVLKNEEQQNQLKKLQEQLASISPKDADKIGKLFLRDIHQNLKTFLVEAENSLNMIPEETKKVEDLITELDKRNRDQIKQIQELVDELKNINEIKKRVNQDILLEKSKTTIENWANSFRNLPSIDNIEAFLDFKVPTNYKKFKYEILAEPKKVQSIFTQLTEIREQLKHVRKIFKKYDVTSENLSSFINAFKKLKAAISSPSKDPLGDKVIIYYSEEQQKGQISIPVDTLIKNPKYLKIYSTPVTHKPREKIDELDELVTAQLKSLTNTISELDSAKNKRKRSKKTDFTLRKLLPILQREAERLEKQRKDNIGKIADFERIWNQKYGSLCRAFAFKPRKIDFSAKESLTSSLEIIKKTLTRSKTTLQKDLKEKLEDFPDISLLKKITEQELNRIIENLYQKIKELSETKERYQKIRDWINKHLEEIQGLESMLKTIKLLNILIVVLKEIFDPIYQNTDLETIIERLAESIEEEVKEAYRRILAEDSLKFEHIGSAKFKNSLNDQPITHPSGSQRAAISLGIMLSLAKTFGLPLMLDEAIDRYDTNHIVTFMEYIMAISENSKNPQISLTIYKTMDVEKNPELISIINGATVYGLERKGSLRKTIKQIDLKFDRS